MRVLLCKDWSESANAYDRRTLRNFIRAYGTATLVARESSEEMMLGAILVQNTNWKNADMALLRLKENKL